MSAVLAAVSDSRPERATEDPWSRLDAEFLTTAGWNPQTETLAPPPDHPLLGFRCCRVQGCRTEAGPADGFCVTCRKAYQLSGMSVEEFATAGPVRQLRRGEVICAVRDCPRPCRNNSITLCQVHDNQRKRLNLSADAVREPSCRATTPRIRCMPRPGVRQAGTVPAWVVRNALRTVVGSAPQRPDDRFRRMVSDRPLRSRAVMRSSCGDSLLRCRPRFCLACRNGVDAA